MKMYITNGNKKYNHKKKNFYYHPNSFYKPELNASLANRISFIWHSLPLYVDLFYKSALHSILPYNTLVMPLKCKNMKHLKMKDDHRIIKEDNVVKYIVFYKMKE